MGFSFTKTDILNSVEVLWRKAQIETLFFRWLIVSTISIIVPIIVIINNLSYWWLALVVWLVMVAIYAIPFMGLIMYSFYKIRYFVKNYSKFNMYEVYLTNFSTSYNSIYYNVKLNYDNQIISTNTNPYFSDSIFARFYPKDYNRQLVVGLYDKYLNKFYIIRKVN